MLARKKLLCYIDNKFSFTFIDAEDYAASEKWQKMLIFILIIASFKSVSVAQW
jgi:hypothetical protein